jgi:hypothetical protein
VVINGHFRDGEVADVRQTRRRRGERYSGRLGRVAGREGEGERGAGVVQYGWRNSGMRMRCGLLQRGFLSREGNKSAAVGSAEFVTVVQWIDLGTERGQAASDIKGLGAWSGVHGGRSARGI